MAKIKFYAVKAGRIPGVYKTWEECQKQTIGYSGAIFKSFSTEQEAQNYINNTNSLTQTTTANSGITQAKWYDVYVDGSFNDGNYSWAFAVFWEDEEIFHDSGVGKNQDAAAIRNVAGELAATMRAIQWADKQKASIVIHHDYTGIAAWATGEWKAKNNFTQSYAKFVQPYLAQIKFCKVTGHSGVKGNEFVDQLAGEALRKHNQL